MPEAPATGDFVAHWRNHMRQDMGNPDLRWRYGEALFVVGDEEGARDAWRRAMVLAPDHAPACLRLADHDFRHDQPEEAVRWLKRIVLRRPGDDGVKIASLCLCLLHADTRRARAFAEDFLAGAGSNRLRGALFHLFRLFGDEERARQAARLGDGERPADVEGRLLAAACAEWAGDRPAAVRQAAALSEMAPGGWALGRKALAQLRAGGEAEAASTLASAVHLFLKQPDQLSDLASMLNWPQSAPLRQVVLSALEREALTEPAASAALALTAYRLGDWPRASAILDGLNQSPEGPVFEVIRNNLRAATATGNALPSDAAGHAFSRDLPGLIPTPPPRKPETGEDRSRVLLVLGPEDDPGRNAMLIEVLRESGADLAVLQTGGVAGGESLPSTEDAGLLSACMHGLPWIMAPGRLPTAGTEELPEAFGYLPPHMVAEIQFLLQAMRASGADMVHVAGSAITLSAGLAALHAGARSVYLHLQGSAIRAGASRYGFFRPALARLLADRRCRALAGSEAEAAEIGIGFAPTREPKVVSPGVDERKVRHNSGGIHRVRAGQALGVGVAAEPHFLVSVLHQSFPPPDWLLSAAADLEDAGIRFVFWEWAVDGAAAHADIAARGLAVLRWPEQPAGFMAHADLGLLVDSPEGLVQPVLAHAAMRTPILPVTTEATAPEAGIGQDMPKLHPVSVKNLIPALRGFASKPAVLADTGEQARLWVQANGHLRHPARRLARLHERDRERA